MGSEVDERDYFAVMRTFPCSFNINMMQKPSQTKLKYLLHKFQQDLAEDQVYHEGEKVMLLDVMTWLHFQVGDINTAKHINVESLRLSPGDIVALGNRAFLEGSSWKLLGAYMKRVDMIRNLPDFQEKLLQAKANQAYFLFRLGGRYNLSLSLEMFTVLTTQRPEKYNWKLFLAFVQRRLDIMIRSKFYKKTVELFEDVAEHASDPYMKSSAYSEMATRLAKNKRTPISRIEELIDKALCLKGDSPTVLMNCGLAMKERSDPKALFYLERSLAMRKSSVTHHMIGKCYEHYMSKYMTPDESARMAAHHYKCAYEYSMKFNTRPLIDMAYLAYCRKQASESKQLYERLARKWALRELLACPYNLSKVYECFFHSNRTAISGDEADVLLKRYRLIAISLALTLFRHDAKRYEHAEFYTKLVDPNYSGRTKAPTSLVQLLKHCDDPSGAMAILTNLSQQDKALNLECLSQAVLELHKSGNHANALLLLDLIDLRFHSELARLIPENIQDQIMTAEASWQLSQGLVCSKQLLHRIFNLRHKLHSTHCRKEFPQPDIVLLHDGPQWKHFRPQNNRGPNHNEDDDDNRNARALQSARTYEEILEYVFDLEVLSNPWLPLSRDFDSSPLFLTQNKPKLVLFFLNEHTSSHFRQLADNFMASIIKENRKDRVFVYTDVAILCGDDTAQYYASRMRHCRHMRHFNARKHGLVRLDCSKPAEELEGLEIISAYFSGNMDKVWEFLDFLAPPIRDSSSSDGHEEMDSSS